MPCQLAVIPVTSPPKLPEYVCSDDFAIVTGPFGNHGYVDSSSKSQFGKILADSKLGLELGCILIDRLSLAMMLGFALDVGDLDGAPLGPIDVLGSSLSIVLGCILIDGLSLGMMLGFELDVGELDGALLGCDEMVAPSVGKKLG